MSEGSASLMRRRSSSGGIGGVDVEMRDLRQRMHAGVGPAGSIQLEVRDTRRLMYRALDLALHRPRVLLNLPAAVAGAGVFDGELEAHGGSALSLHSRWHPTVASLRRRSNRRMSDIRRRYPVGAEAQPDGSTHFRVWAPNLGSFACASSAGRRSRATSRSSEKADGYYSALVDDAGAGTRYRYRLDGDPLADPASRFQPDGPFGPSEVVDPARFRWEQTRRGRVSSWRAR